LQKKKQDLARFEEQRAEQENERRKAEEKREELHQRVERSYSEKRNIEDRLTKVERELKVQSFKS
jgi:hypothetical protein